MLFSSGSEQKSIMYILYRFSVLSSIYICVVFINLYYILCKYINRYNMLIHVILRILISTEGIFHFVVYRRADITGSLQIRDSLALFSYRKQENSLQFSHTFHVRQYSCPAVFSPSIIRRLFSIGRGDILRHSLSCTVYIFQRIFYTA